MGVVCTLIHPTCVRGSCTRVHAYNHSKIVSVRTFKSITHFLPQVSRDKITSLLESLVRFYNARFNETICMYSAPFRSMHWDQFLYSAYVYRALDQQILTDVKRHN